MSDQFWLTKAQLKGPFFPRTHGIPRADDGAWSAG